MLCMGLFHVLAFLALKTNFLHKKKTHIYTPKTLKIDIDA